MKNEHNKNELDSELKRRIERSMVLIQFGWVFISDETEIFSVFFCLLFEIKGPWEYKGGKKGWQ